MKQNQKYGVLMSIIFSLIMVWLPSCSKDGNETPETWKVTVTGLWNGGNILNEYKQVEDIWIEWDQHIVTLNFYSNMEWRYEGGSADVMVVPGSGKAGQHQLKVYIETNQTKFVKEKHFSLRPDPYIGWVKITIHQKGKPFIRTSRDTFFVLSPEDTKTCTVTSNIENLVIECSSWITAIWASSPSPGTHECEIDRELSIRCERNDSYNGREGYVTIKSQDGSVYATITVKQVNGL